MSDSVGKLQFIELTKRYGSGPPAVDRVSFSVESGQFVALLGASGSGKTTILMMTAGFTDVTSGDIRLAGHSIIGLPPEQRGLGVVFQNYALFPHLSVEDNITFPLEMRACDRAETQRRVAEALELVGLSALRRRRPHELSGGQQQRVALARAMIFRPSVLLMDEPLGALDKHLRERMQLELRSMHRLLGTTVLYVTHDQREALVLADTIAVMREGHIEQIGPPEEIYNLPRNRFVASFIGDCNFLKVDAALSKGAGWDVNVKGYAGHCLGPGPAAGDDPVLAIRPHHCALDFSLGKGAPGRLVDAVFLGSAIEYAVELDGGGTALVHRPFEEGVLRTEPGTSICLSWSWKNARLL